MRFFTLLLCTIFLGFQATAQLESYPQESSMSLGKQPALVLDINEIDKATAIKYWTAYVKEHGKMKKNKKAGELYAEDIRIPAISSEKFDLYSKVEDLKGNSRLYIWIDTGEMFLTSDNDASPETYDLKNKRAFSFNR